MDHLYPCLEDKFKSEGLCPICMMEMELTPKFACVNDHILCHRCKPYYFSCPKCHSPIDVEIKPPEMNFCNRPSPVCAMPQPNTHLPTHMPMPVPIPRPMPRPTPCAPREDFHIHERQSTCAPSAPTENPQLYPCSYTKSGCWVKFPDHLRQAHESRCQHRNFEEDQQSHCYPDMEISRSCIYKEAGCNIQLTESRKKEHEEDCPFKGRFEALEKLRCSIDSVTLNDDSSEERNECNQDPNQIVECRFRKYGCMVKMPFRRKSIHEEKCNFLKCESDEEEETCEDPEQQMDCKWTDYGCRVRPKLYRKDIHEEKCNYKPVGCSFKG